MYNKIWLTLVVACLLSVFGACTSQKSGTEVEAAARDVIEPVDRVVKPYLEKDYAAMRARQIEAVDYQLSVVLSDESDQFSGRLEADFVLAPGNRADLTIDFTGGTVESLSLNGESVAWEYNDWFITIDSGELAPGKNSVEITYTRPYATDGDGLHRYIDSETENQYLYTNFEPYNANKLFPHFDQPDIKARYILDVLAPSDWTVISATREHDVKDLGKQRHWFFPQSALIPSYIFPLHAGPYHVWEEVYRQGDYEVPMRLFARQELAEYVQEKDWFQYTRQSFDFFNDYFNAPYMFEKYDQVIVPEFNAGAMENLAAVTFTERFVSRGPKVEAEKIRLANVIAHEMAHMWFGNLVTMEWWNGLWLNESFATYMAYLQLDQNSDFDNTWDTFYSSTKQWAYRTDQQVTTHPIELPVPNTAEAFTNFDGITYGKGASVLKQLPYYLGAEKFRRGVVNYLNRHAYDNTELNDFIGALEQAAEQDLSGWTQEWLYEAGLNTIRAEFSCTENRLASLVLKQTAPEGHPTLRSQRVQVGLFELDADSGANFLAGVPVTYKGAETPVQFPEGIACPDLIYPNLDDWGYVKVQLDQRSQSTLEQSIHQFADNGLRIMLWQGLWDSVRDQQMRLTDFVRFAADKLPAESDNRIVSQVGYQLAQSSSYLWLMDPQGTEYGTQRDDIAELFWRQLQQAEAGSDQQRIWFSQWLRAASAPVDFARAQELLKEEASIEGLTLHQDFRWGLVLLLNRFAYGDYLELAQAEAKRDGSARGEQSALGVEASRPDAALKEEWLNNITEHSSDYKLAQLREVMSKLFPSNQVALREIYADRILTALPKLTQDQGDRFVSLYAGYLLPINCTEKSLQRMVDAIDQYSGLHPSLDDALRIAHQEDQRCVRMKELLE